MGTLLRCKSFILTIVYMQYQVLGPAAALLTRPRCMYMIAHAATVVGALPPPPSQHPHQQWCVLCSL